MKKIIILILTTVFLFSLCIAPISCDKKQVESEEGQQRYTWDKGVHDFTAPERQNDYIVKDGATDYVLVVPAKANDKIELAVDEFKVLFKRATNIEIPTIRDNSGDPILTNDNAKRISIGETSLITKMSKEEQNWRAEEDARTMAAYQEILGDKARMGRAIKVAKRQAQDLSKRAEAMNNVARTRTKGKK